MDGTVSKVRKGTGFVSAEELPGDDDEDEDEDWIFLIVIGVGAGTQAAMFFVSNDPGLVFLSHCNSWSFHCRIRSFGFLQSVFLCWYLAIVFCRRRFYRWIIFIVTSLFPNSLPSCCHFLVCFLEFAFWKMCTKYPGPPFLPLYNPSRGNQDSGETSTEGMLPSPPQHSDSEVQVLAWETSFAKWFFIQKWPDWHLRFCVRNFWSN